MARRPTPPDVDALRRGFGPFGGIDRVLGEPCPTAERCYEGELGRVLFLAAYVLAGTRVGLDGELAASDDHALAAVQRLLAGALDALAEQDDDPCIGRRVAFRVSPGALASLIFWHEHMMTADDDADA